MNVAVTGAAGYVGQRLMARLGANPNVEQIVGLDIQPLETPPPPNGVFQTLDIRDPALGEILRHYGIDTLVHAAFILFPHPRRLALMEQVNVGGTANVLRACREARIRRLVVLSSIVAYGAWSDNPIPLTEEHPLRPNPTYPYGVHKGQVERLCQEFSKEHPQTACIILRPPGILGPRARGPLADFLRRPRAVIVDGGRAPGQFVHEDDLVDLIEKSLQSDARGPFNATPDDWLPWREIWSRAGKQLMNFLWPVARLVFGLLWQIEQMDCVTHPGQVNLTRFPLVASNEKARRELNWQPAYTTLQTVQDFLAGERDESSH
ncbi:MAG: NAD-dependent epimerase/dehydratase family protein [Thermoflexales bacterium]|nr:NAD-dependent epimerase/dehydratase family protein [Thermoflexales bacterium]